MFGFNRKKILIAFLNNAELKVAAYRQSSKGAERTGTETLTFADDIVRDSSILNPDLFSAEVGKFLAGKPEWKGMKTVLVIPEEKIFIKGSDLDIGDLERKTTFRDAFLAEIPFAQEELIVRERLIGRVLEFSAVHKKFVADFRKPFLDAHCVIAGLISVPQAIALGMNPPEKSFLLAFYDNDFALALVEHASILFSETWRLSDRKVKEAAQAFDHFVRQLKAADIKSISIIVGEDELEDAMKLELEHRDYAVAQARKISITDLVAEYYGRNATAEKEWNLLYVEPTGFAAWMRKWRMMFFVLLVVTALSAALFFGWHSLTQRLARLGEPIAPAPVEPIATTTPQVATTTPAVPVKNSDFPVAILNGTKVAGEATRLKASLAVKGFSVISTGNNADQTQVVTTIFTKPDVPDAAVSDARIVLEAGYQQVLVNPSLATSSPVSMRIVIGKKK